jgi:hypothetical protein
LRATASQFQLKGENQSPKVEVRDSRSLSSNFDFRRLPGCH